MLVKDLIGAELEFYVAKAEGKSDVELRTAQRATNKICIVKASGGRQFDYTYSPSTQWAVAGPIIERERIPLKPLVNGSWSCEYPCWPSDDVIEPRTVWGETALIAAMRWYVQSKFGSSVDPMKD